MTDRIRIATAADTADLAAIYRAAEGAVRAELGAGTVEAVDLAAWFAARVDAHRFFLAPGGGFIEVAPPDELCALYVTPARWGSGLAAALHDHGIAGLPRPLRLIVIAGNARARRFYERHGWTLAGDDAPRVIGGIELAFVRYVLA